MPAHRVAGSIGDRHERVCIPAALLGSLSLAACAHTQPESTYVAPEEIGLAPVNALVQRQDVDYAYVAAVERLARSRGVEVKWVNMPLRRIDTQ